MTGMVDAVARRPPQARLRRLRMLFVYGGWLRPELGAARGILDVAEALAATGHEVSTYSFADVFEDESLPRYPWADPRVTFARRARDFIRSRAPDFDVIDANEGCLPYSKRELGFDGVLVASSCGLVGLYDDYLRYERERWPGRIPGMAVTRAAARLRQRGTHRDALRSLRAADLVRVINPDEQHWVVNVAQVPARRVSFVPLGLNDQRRTELEFGAGSPASRLGCREVLFIGTWTLRKGRADIPAIVEAVARRVPEARFHFVGTYEDEAVRAELARHAGRVRVTPTFPSSALPELFSTASVVIAPSYAEGFHLGVLEALAAGVPAIAYDIPGPRFMLSRIDRHRLLVRRGDAADFGGRVAEVLLLDEREYVQLSDDCRAATSDLRSDLLAQSFESTLLELTGGA